MWVPGNPHEWIPSTTVRLSVVNTSASSCHALPKTITLVLTPNLCTFSQKVPYLREELYKILSLKLFCCFWYQHRQEAVKNAPWKKHEFSLSFADQWERRWTQINLGMPAKPLKRVSCYVFSVAPYPEMTWREGQCQSTRDIECSMRTLLANSPWASPGSVACRKCC